MITVSNLSLSFSGQALFKNVDLKFTEGNCYGVIGANGAGKSTFLRILSGELEPTGGEVILDAKNRMSVLKQDHFAFDAYTVLDTIIMGNQKLYDIMKQKDALYAKEDFSEEDGILASELEYEFSEMNGWEVCRKIRETSDVPVIFLTARGEEFDELECFECGADDFITKPFSPTVLVKRIEARLKRTADNPTDKIVIDGLVIDVVAHSVVCDGHEIELTHKEYGILHKLASNRERVFSREQLLDDIWGFDFLGDSRTVDSHVARLRTKLGDWGSRHLRTVYGAGYKIEVN